jgi:hypothetical protein
VLRKGALKLCRKKLGERRVGIVDGTGTAERHSVREVILTEISIISDKIKSLYETVREQTLKEAKWSDVVTGKHKKNRL